MKVSYDFLELHLPLTHLLVHSLFTISRHALGDGGSVINFGTKSPSMHVHPTSVSLEEYGVTSGCVFC